MGSGKLASKVRVTTIDDQMHSRGRVDFIKIDAEGFEENILLGAARTMKKYKPILSFSAYHKPGDKEELPALVISIRPDYSCRLMNRSEEDIYCE